MATRSARGAIAKGVLHYGTAVLLVAASALLRYLLHDVLGPNVPFITFFPAVMFAALIGGLGPGIVAVVLCTLVSVIVFEPVGSVQIRRPQDQLGLLLFVLVGIAIAALAEAQRRARSRAASSEVQTEEAQRALFESEQRFRRTLARSGVLVFNQDLDLRYVWIGNSANRERAKTAIGKTDHEILPPAEAEQMTQLSRKVLETGVGHHEEMTFKVDHHEAAYDMYFEPDRDARGEIVGVSVVGVDVSERKAARDALRTSEMTATKRLLELEILYDLSPVGLCFVDAELRYIRINERLAAINGHPVQEHIGRTVGEVLGEGAAPIEAHMREVLATGKPIRNLEISGRSLSGDLGHFLANYDPVLDSDDQPLGVNVVVIDVTQRKDAEIRAQLLTEATRTLAGSLDYEKTLDRLAEATVPVFADWCAVDVLEEDGSLERLAVKHVDPEKIRWARELEKKYPPDPNATTGVPAVIRTGKSELYKEIPRELLVAAAVDDEHMRIIDEIGFTSAIVVPLVARDRVLGALSLVWAETGKHYDDDDLAAAEELGRRAGIAVDNARLYQAAQREVEERKRAEEEVRRLNAELERRVAERTAELRSAMGELEAFCYSVSHDLRAPMRSLSGNSRILIEDFGKDLNEDGRDHLQRISTAASKMGVIIDDLLQFSRLGRAQLKFQTVSLTQLVEAAVEHARAQYPEVSYSVQIQPDMTVCGDASVLGLAVQNLVDNAFKYSSKVKDPTIEFGQMEQDGSPVYFVKDNGVGFDMEYVDKIFVPFERLHRDAEYPGTGIGLANVSRVIMRHGGKIWAKSAPGEGAAFFFTIPADCEDGSGPMIAEVAPPYLG